MKVSNHLRDISDLDVCICADEMFAAGSFNLPMHLMIQHGCCEKIAYGVINRATQRGYIDWGVSERGAFVVGRGYRLMRTNGVIPKNTDGEKAWEGIREDS